MLRERHGKLARIEHTRRCFSKLHDLPERGLRVDKGFTRPILTARYHVAGVEQLIGNFRRTYPSLAPQLQIQIEGLESAAIEAETARNAARSAQARLMVKGTEQEIAAGRRKAACFFAMCRMRD